MVESIARPRQGATTVTAAATAVAASTTVPATSIENEERKAPTPVDLESDISAALDISRLVQWIVAAQQACRDVNFHCKHSEEFAAKCEMYKIDAPAWDGFESTALITVLRHQEVNLSAVLAHLEGGAA
ncbi:hypothetical protein [Variovorax sp. JS1663]|uniref:hypothetical protein n=1 Tax=Variovorax sp. JS1663 TaxID=1851577 RepID=UPI000B34429F|nr:hypothetical protein [Variovorax sp. JS1663]OUM01783.1 hypothetical protein A8M77_14575 [Variovorax sp. JS1663]